MTTVVKTRKPNLRFKEFRENWTSNTLQDLNSFSIKSGKSTKKTESGEYPFYGSTGLIGYSDIFDNSNDAILIARVGANAGSLYKVTGKYNVSDNTLIVSISNSYNLDFLFEYLTQYNLKRLVFGTGQPLVTGGMIKKINIFYPSLSEQNKISKFLSVVDEKINQLTQQYESLNQYKKGIMRQIFSQEIYFKRNDSSSFEDWKEQEIEKLTSLVSYGLTVRPKFVESGVKLISAREIRSGEVDYLNAPCISQEDYNALSSKAKPKKLDLLFSKTGSIGFTAIVKKDFEFAITQNIAVIRLNDFDQHNPLFYLYQLRTNNFQRKAMSLVNQSTIMDLQLGDIKKIKLLTCCIEEQTKIANFLTTINEKINQSSKQLKLTKKWKQGLLQQMFI